MNPMLMYIAGAGLTLAVLCVRSRAAGASLGILIGGLHCAIHGLKGWNATPVLALCMLGGALLAGLLRRGSRGGVLAESGRFRKEEDYFASLREDFRLVVDRLGLPATGWTNAMMIDLGCQFTDRLLTSREGNRIARGSEAGRWIEWLVSTSVYAGIYAARTGRLEPASALIESPEGHGMAMLELNALLLPAMTVESEGFIQMLLEAFEDRTGVMKGGLGLRGLLDGTSAIHGAVRAAFQTGAALAMGQPDKE